VEKKYRWHYPKLSLRNHYILELSCDQEKIAQFLFERDEHRQIVPQRLGLYIETDKTNLEEVYEQVGSAPGIIDLDKATLLEIRSKLEMFETGKITSYVYVGTEKEREMVRAFREKFGGQINIHDIVEARVKEFMDLWFNPPSKLIH